MKVSRRTYLKSIGKTVKVLISGGLLTGIALLFQQRSNPRYTARPRVDEKPEYVFRPPGAMAEDEFLARCIHCYLCQDVCPPGCIQMKPDSVADRHTPFIEPRLKACTMCLKCGDVCPTGALQPLAEMTEVKMGIAEIDKELCVSHLRTGVCGACFTACPLKGEAITQGMFNAPEVHSEFCTGCGLCEEVCIVAYRAIRVAPLSAGKETAV